LGEEPQSWLGVETDAVTVACPRTDRQDALGERHRVRPRLRLRDRRIRHAARAHHPQAGAALLK
jgi:hypothetical protein